MSRRAIDEAMRAALNAKPETVVLVDEDGAPIKKRRRADGSDVGHSGLCFVHFVKNSIVLKTQKLDFSRNSMANLKKTRFLVAYFINF